MLSHSETPFRRFEASTRRASAPTRRASSASMAVVVTRELLDGAGEEALHEVALQAEEDDERHDHEQEGARREQMPLGAVLAQQVLDRARHRELARVRYEDEHHEQVVPDPAELEE